jgi:hypothetical protein
MIDDTIRKILVSGELSGGVDEDFIRQAELELGTRFPPSYREFLTQYGAAVCTGLDVAGLFTSSNNDAPPLWSNVVKSTIQRRKASRGLLPHEYLFIGDDGGDYSFFLDTSRAHGSGECPVIALGPGVDASIVADDFEDFLRRSLSGTLKY